MAEIPLRDQILEAINVTRQRKARPDRERIRNYMLRHFSVARSDTDVALEQLVSSGDVIVEVYKGYISYRNAILCSRRVLHKDIIYPKSNEDVKAHTSVIQGFYELSLQQPDYLDTGVPEDVLRKYLSITGRVVPEGGLIRALSKEIKSGFLAQLSNGNYVLRFNKEPLNTTVDRRKWLQNTCQDSSAYKPARNRSLSSNPPNISNSNISKVVSSREAFNEKDGQNSVGNWNVGSSNQSYRDDTLSRNVEQRENAAGLRLGTRKKKAKKVFDPSFMHPPTRKRGRPPLKKNTCMKHTMINKPLCSICNRQKSGDIVLCANCKKIAHYTCAFAKCDVDSVQNPWTCSECRICTFCLEPSESELMEICFKCDNAYHYSCHVPPITEKKLTGNWICSFCDESNPQFNVKVVNGPECRQSVCRNFVDVQQQNMEIIREIKLENSKTLSYPLFPKTAMCKIFIDDNTPDASNWSSEEVYKYLVTRGCAEQASVFQENEIDGYSLLMLTRNDVLYNLNLKLGPALKVYLEVQILQAKVAGRCSVYYE